MTKPAGFVRHGAGMYGYQTSSTQTSGGATAGWASRFENPYDSANLTIENHNMSGSLYTKPIRAF
jgi:hypothetical protein